MKKAALFLPLSRLFSMLAEDALFVMLPILVFRASGQIKETGLVVFLGFAGRVLGFPLSGLLSDSHLGERKVYATVAALRGLLCLLAAMALTGPAAFPYWVPEVLSLLMGLMTGVTNVSFEASVPRSVPHSRLGHVQARVQLADQIALLGAPFIGTLLVARFGLSAALLPTAALFFLSCATFVGWTRDPQTKPRRPTFNVFASFAQLAASARLAARNRALVWIVALTLLDNLLLGLHSASSAVLVLGRYGSTETVLGLVLSGAAAVALFFSLFNSHFGKHLFTYWIASYALSYAGFFVIGWADSLLAYGLGVALIETSCAMGIYALRLLRPKLIPDEHFGRVLAMLYSVQQSSLPIGGLLVSTVRDPATIQTTFVWTSAGALLATLLIFVLGISELRRIADSTMRSSKVS